MNKNWQNFKKAETKEIENMDYRHYLWHQSRNDFVKQYPYLKFDSPGPKDPCPGGKSGLFAIEPHASFPNNYNLEILKKYDSYITSSGEFFKVAKENGINATFVAGSVRWFEYKTPNSHEHSKHFKDFNEKINGISLFSRSRTVNNRWLNEHNRRNDINDGNIIALREYLFKKIKDQTKSNLTFDLYGTSGAYGGLKSKGYVNNKFEVITKYKYHLCFDSSYHHIFSPDRISEKIIDCLFCKTIPVYLGCWNIEEYISTDCFIDFRKYTGNLQGLVDYMENITRQQYIDMTELGFEIASELVKNYGTKEQLTAALDKTK